MKLALCGRAGSGKTTLATFLVTELGFGHYSFADAIKRLAQDLFGMEDKNRTLLQQIGQNMREIDPMVWINYTLNAIDADGYPDVVIDDLRYVNEELALREEGFIIVKLVGRQWKMSPGEMSHESETEVDLVRGDYTIDTLASLESNYRSLMDIVVMEKVDEGRMSAKYYGKADEKANKNYVRGRNFEYKVMGDLRRRGYHPMRRFASKGEWVWVDDEKVHIPIDLTAYRDGQYLMISVKWSSYRATTYLDEPERDNLVRVAGKFGAIPVFAGVNKERQVYYVDLRACTPLDLMTRRYRLPKEEDKADSGQFDKLIGVGWFVVDVCLKEYEAAGDDARLRAKWADALIKIVNVMHRLLYRAGATSTEDELTQMIEEATKKGDEDVGA